MKITNTYNIPIYRYSNISERTNRPVSSPVLAENNANFNAHAVQNIAFHGLFSTSLEDKINAAANRLDEESMLVVGPDMDTCLNCLRRTTQDIDWPIKKLFFVKNEKPENNNEYAIFKKDNKFKIFKLYPLDEVLVLTGGTDRWALSVKCDFTDSEPQKAIEVKKGQYISWGFADNKECIKFLPNYHMGDSEFKKHVESYSYFEDNDAIKSFNDNMLIKLNNRNKVSGIKKITFKDVGGQDEIIAQLEESVIFPINCPELYEGYRTNKGILLYGPPRCGKTLMALALANEARANFIKLGADDLTHSHVGQTEENWRKTFEEARSKQPTIIFIDEFDAIAKRRSGSDTSRYQDNIVNQILVLMSDLEKSNDQVYVIAATNRRDLIDGAMLDSGRFGLCLEVKEPNLEGTKQIFDIHKRGKKISDDIDEQKLIERMHENHFNGSNIAEIFSLAHSKALKRLNLHEKMRNKTISKQDITGFKLIEQDLEEAIDLIIKQKKDDNKRNVVKGFKPQ